MSKNIGMASLAALVLCAPLACLAETATPEASSLIQWERVQGRMALGTVSSPSLGKGLAHNTGTGLVSAAPPDAPARLSSVSLIGDYYLGPSAGTPLNQIAPTGLRATTSLMLGKRAPLWGMSSTSTGLLGDNRNPMDPSGESNSTPYLGIGYTGAAAKGSWGFTADLGVMSLSPGQVVRFGKVFNGTQNLDDVVRDLRLAPVLQLGISYAF